MFYFNKKRQNPLFAVVSGGGDKENRTPDLRIAKNTDNVKFIVFFQYIMNCSFKICRLFAYHFKNKLFVEKYNKI